MTAKRSQLPPWWRNKVRETTREGREGTRSREILEPWVPIEESVGEQRPGFRGILGILFVLSYQLMFFQSFFFRFSQVDVMVQKLGDDKIIDVQLRSTDIISLHATRRDNKTR